MVFQGQAPGTVGHANITFRYALRAPPAWRDGAVSVSWYVVSGALLHRLLPRALRRHAVPHVLPWADLALLASELPDGILAADHERLVRLRPADIARIANALPVRQTAEIVASLADGIAADTMPAEAADAHALLIYPKHTADRLMTTDYAIATADLWIAETAAYLRPQLARRWPSPRAR